MKLSKRYEQNFGIYFAEDEDPLSWAAFGAFTSRNNGNFEDLLGKVTAESRQRLIETTYIAYGHGSIGDMVDVKMFLEGVPIWLAFELEGFSRFRGQESSTRYIDFSNQKLMSYYAEMPGVSDWYNQKILDYVNAFDKVWKRLQEDIPGDVEHGLHLRAARARAFDLTRCLIPSICTTNMVWYGSINEIRQHLAYLQSQKIPFIKEIIEALDQQYPETKPIKPVRFRFDPWASPPAQYVEENHFILSGDLDFGSYRDLRRHRRGTHRIHNISENYIHEWYTARLIDHDILTEIPLMYNKDGKDLYIESFRECPPLLGTGLNIVYECDLEQAQYLSALRTKLNVHGSLRELILSNWKTETRLSSYMDVTPDIGSFGYYLVRGTETLEFKGNK